VNEGTPFRKGRCLFDEQTNRNGEPHMAKLKWKQGRDSDRVIEAFASHGSGGGMYEIRAGDGYLVDDGHLVVFPYRSATATGGPSERVRTARQRIALAQEHNDEKAAEAIGANKQEEQMTRLTCATCGYETWRLEWKPIPNGLRAWQAPASHVVGGAYLVTGFERDDAGQQAFKAYHCARNQRHPNDARRLPPAVASLEAAKALAQADHDALEA
jgi:hypothetical protein